LCVGSCSPFCGGGRDGRERGGCGLGHAAAMQS
jgi:hypothetical protein